jgi:SAM-dependent methyltransferase
MEKGSNSARPAFWNERYRSAETPWVLHKTPNALRSFLKTTKKRGRVLIPGCGTHYEAIEAFRAGGFEVVAIDFSAVAIANMRKALARSGTPGLVHGDFFKHNFRTRFDLIYERTFLCALHPRRWPRYAKRVVQLLRPGGKLIGVFFYGTEPEPPPYPLTKARANEIFGPYFRLIRDTKVSDSAAMFAGMERWQEWERIPARY